jgi:hypothetical protein
MEDYIEIENKQYYAVRILGKKNLWHIVKSRNVRVASGIQGRNSREAIANWQLTLPGSQNVSQS